MLLYVYMTWNANIPDFGMENVWGFVTLDGRDTGDNFLTPDLSCIIDQTAITITRIQSQVYKAQTLGLHGIAIYYAFIMYLLHNQENDEDSNMVVLFRVQMFLCITPSCLKSSTLSLWCSLSPQNQRKCLQNVDMGEVRDSKWGISKISLSFPSLCQTAFLRAENNLHLLFS